MASSPTTRDDIVMFDVPPPYDGVRGIDDYRDTWPGFFKWQLRGATFDILSLEVTAGEDVAFAHALLRCGTQEEHDANPANRLRLTIGLRKEEGPLDRGPRAPLVPAQRHGIDPGRARPSSLFMTMDPDARRRASTSSPRAAPHAGRHGLLRPCYVERRPPLEAALPPGPFCPRRGTMLSTTLLRARSLRDLDGSSEAAEPGLVQETSRTAPALNTYSSVVRQRHGGAHVVDVGGAALQPEYEFAPRSVDRP